MLIFPAICCMPSIRPVGRNLFRRGGTCWRPWLFEKNIYFYYLCSVNIAACTISDFWNATLLISLNFMLLALHRCQHYPPNQNFSRGRSYRPPPSRRSARNTTYITHILTVAWAALVSNGSPKSSHQQPRQLCLQYISLGSKKCPKTWNYYVSCDDVCIFCCCCNESLVKGQLQILKLLLLVCYILLAWRVQKPTNVVRLRSRLLTLLIHTWCETNFRTCTANANNPKCWKVQMKCDVTLEGPVK